MTGDPTREERGGGLLEALVEGERASLQPPADAERRTWKRVAGTVAVGAPLPVDPTTIAGPTASVHAATPWIKVVLGVVLGGAVAAGGYGLSTRGEPTTAASTETPAADPRDGPPDARHSGAAGRARPTPSDARVAPLVPEPPSPAASPPVDDGPARSPVAVGPAPSPAAIDDGPAPPPVDDGPAPPPVDDGPAVASPRAAPPGAPPDATPSDLAEETRLLARARAHLRSGTPSAALPFLEEHARRFPHGQLTEDRMVLRAQALCESGETEAGLAQADLLSQAFPTSSHLPRVHRACD